MANADEMLLAAAAAADRLAMPDAGARPRRRVAVLTCMDARIDPLALLGLERGDAHVIRNAGGLVTDDAIRSISVSQRVLDTEEVVVVMHEGCGLCGASDEQFARELAQDGAQPAWRLGGFERLEPALRSGLQALRASPELRCRDRIRGLIFDPKSGRLREPA
jgi:carbonic anhydrase